MMRYLYLCPVSTGPSRCGDRRLPADWHARRVHVFLLHRSFEWVVDVSGWRIHERGIYVGGCFARHVSVKRILPSTAFNPKKSDLGLDCSGCQPRTFCSVCSVAASHRLEKMTQWELGLNFSHISTNDAKIGLFMIIYYCFGS